MKRHNTIHIFRLSAVAALALAAVACASSRADATLTIIETCDLHGEFGEPMGKLIGYIDSVRTAEGTDNVVLLDGGDILQGTPQVFYANSIASPTEPHIYASLFNGLKYDAITLGNHDFEAGGKIFATVYDHMKMPVVVANVLDATDGKPFFKPYTVIRRKGYKIAVLGLTTSYSYTWLPEELRRQLVFQPMEEAAAEWIEIIRRKERPDVIVGLFHSGYNDESGVDDLSSNDDYVSTRTAYNVAGFDLICCAHTHSLKEGYIVNINGDTVRMIQGGATARGVAQARLHLTDKGIRSITTSVATTEPIAPSTEYMQHIAGFNDAVKEFDSSPVCQITRTIRSNDELRTGGSAWVELIHKTMREVTIRTGIDSLDIDVTVACPYLADAVINAGTMTIGDCISLYPYESTLSIIEMTGAELIQYLQYVYDLRYSRFENAPIYCFDSLDGVFYEVNRNAPRGEHVTVEGMSNGKLYAGRRYHVVMTSFRAQGGGGHLSNGLGWSDKKIIARRIWESQESFLDMMIKLYRDKGVISPEPAANRSIQ